ncbi:MAG: arylesterase [Gammaproteobacteria bacterium]|nr:arylesterase [Gammaproteobacteria bacterium]
MLVAGPSRAADDGARRPILVLGDSLSAGYGIDLAQAWPSLLDSRLRLEGYPYRVVNASISGETTVGGGRRLPALLTEHQPAIVVVALGANDGLRGLPAAEVRKNLASMLEAALAAHAVPVLLQVRVPPNYGPQYTASFEAVFGEFFARPDVVPGPFLLEGFAADASAFQADGLHPVAAMEPRILTTLWPALVNAMDVVKHRKENP